MERLGWIAVVVLAVAAAGFMAVLWSQARSELKDTHELLASSRAEVNDLNADLAHERSPAPTSTPRPTPTPPPTASPEPTATPTSSPTLYPTKDPQPTITPKPGRGRYSDQYVVITELPRLCEGWFTTAGYVRDGTRLDSHEIHLYSSGHGQDYFRDWYTFASTPMNLAVDRSFSVNARIQKPALDGVITMAIWGFVPYATGELEIRTATVRICS